MRVVPELSPAPGLAGGDPSVTACPLLESSLPMPEEVEEQVLAALAQCCPGCRADTAVAATVDTPSVIDGLERIARVTVRIGQ